MQKKIHVFAPATVGNISCGFDILGFALQTPGDEVIIRIRNVPGVKITKISGDRGQLPLRPEANTAGVAAILFLEKYALDYGVELELYKKMPLSSGLGSSAASAAATLFGLNEMFDGIADRDSLLKFALQSESIACGAEHGDNIIPSLLGGIILIHSYNPLDVITLPVPEELCCSLIYPHLQVRTEAARSVLPRQIDLNMAVQQWGNIAGLVAGLYRSDYGLISRSLVDVIAEPARSKLIPHFYRLKQAALTAGALGSGISGSGPSVFALCRGKKTAEKVGAAMQLVCDEVGLSNDVYISQINQQGPQIKA